MIKLFKVGHKVKDVLLKHYNTIVLYLQSYELDRARTMRMNALALA